MAKINFDTRSGYEGGFHEGRSAGYSEGWAAGYAAGQQVQQKLHPEWIKRLIRLCHPDKHGNSKLATEMTQWLLSMR